MPIRVVPMSLLTPTLLDGEVVLHFANKARGEVVLHFANNARVHLRSSRDVRFKAERDVSVSCPFHEQTLVVHSTASAHL